MESEDIQNQGPPAASLLLLASVQHSGASLVSRAFEALSGCAVTRQLLIDYANTKDGGIKSDETLETLLEGLKSHDAFVEATKEGKAFLICGEEGVVRKDEHLHSIVNNQAVFAGLLPVFLLRDPVRVFDTAKSQGSSDIESVIAGYTNIFDILARAPSRSVGFLVYEEFILDPQYETSKLCSRWGIPFSQSTSVEEVFQDIMSSASTTEALKNHGLLSNNEKDQLEEAVGRSYVNLWKYDVRQLRKTFSNKQWFGFDLDDTLHEFRRASKIATNSVLDLISKKYNLEISDLSDTYTGILKEKTSNAFSDGKTSFEYRRERFASVLSKFKIPIEEEFISQCLEIYEKSLVQAHELKCGAIGLLSLLKKLGKKVVIVTEGPQDAQERTVEALGINDYIDFLATTNYFGVPKTDGLFGKVLNHLGITAADIVYVGDSKERDIEPATKEGILAIHLDEANNIALGDSPPRINTLRKLEYILSE